MLLRDWQEKRVAVLVKTQKNIGNDLATIIAATARKWILCEIAINRTTLYEQNCLSASPRDRVGIAVKNPEIIDITWFQGLLFGDRTKSVLQVLL